MSPTCSYLAVASGWWSTSYLALRSLKHSECRHGQIQPMNGVPSHPFCLTNSPRINLDGQQAKSSHAVASISGSQRLLTSSSLHMPHWLAWNQPVNFSLVATPETCHAMLPTSRSLLIVRCEARLWSVQGATLVWGYCARWLAVNTDRKTP